MNTQMVLFWGGRNFQAGMEVMVIGVPWNPAKAVAISRVTHIPGNLEYFLLRFKQMQILGYIPQLYLEMGQRTGTGQTDSVAEANGLPI